MEKIYLINFTDEELLLLRQSYLDQIAYCKQRHNDCDYVTHLENEVSNINIELAERDWRG